MFHIVLFNTGWFKTGKGDIYCHPAYLTYMLSESEVKSSSHVQIFSTPWAVDCQAPPSMGFSRQEYWSSLHFPFPGDISQPRDQIRVSCTAGRLFTVWATREAYMLSPSCKTPGWIKHSLVSRLPGKISITSDKQMIPHLWQKVKRN